MFNPVQLFLQAQTLTHIAAVAGIPAAMRAIPAGVMFSLLRLGKNEANIKHFAGMWAKMTGGKAEHFIDSFQAVQKMGLYHVEGEVGVLNDVLDPPVFRNSVGRFFLDKGKFFFTEGERLARLSGWHAAYMEKVTELAGKTMTERDLQAILVRANDLNLNQTRASIASWQTGIAAPMTQFWGYQARMMEQFLGNRVMTTIPQKLHAFGVYAAMYGVPVGVTGTALGFYPWSEDIRQGLLERGINPEANVWNTFNNGIPSMMLKVITGEDYNMNERYGPGGLPFLKEVMSGQKGLIDVFLGASGSVTKSFIENLDPAMFTLGRIVSGDLSQTRVLAGDLAQMAKDISSVSLATRLVTALNIGKLVTKGEITLSDATQWDTIMTAFGLTPRQVSDAFLKIKSLGNLSEQQKLHKNRAVMYIRRGLQAMKDGNEDGRAAYFDRASLEMAVGSFLPKQRSDALSEALKGYETLAKTVDWSFVQKMRATPYGDDIMNQYYKGKP